MTSSNFKARALSADDILSGGENACTPLEVPELTKNGEPGVVWIKSLSAGAVMDFAARADKDKPEAERNQAMLEMIAKAIVNEDGSPMFTEEQAARLREMSMAVFNRFVTAVNGLTGIGKKDEAGKGSSETASTVSPTV